MSVIIIAPNPNLSEDNLEKNLVTMLSVLLSPLLSAEKKKQILQEIFHISMTKEIRKEVAFMCNYSDGVEARGIEKGIRQGISQGISQAIGNLMKNLHMTAEQAMDVLSIPPEERKKYTDLV